jgi:hypothetical protein
MLNLIPAVATLLIIVLISVVLVIIVEERPKAAVPIPAKSERKK